MATAISSIALGVFFGLLCFFAALLSHDEDTTLPRALRVLVVGGMGILGLAFFAFAAWGVVALIGGAQ